MPGRIKGPSGALWGFTGGISGSPFTPGDWRAYTLYLKSLYKIFH